MLAPGQEATAFARSCPCFRLARRSRTPRADSNPYCGCTGTSLAIMTCHWPARHAARWYLAYRNHLRAASSSRMRQVKRMQLRTVVLPGRTCLARQPRIAARAHLAMM